MTGSECLGPEAPQPSHKLVEERPIDLGNAQGQPHAR